MHRLEHHAPPARLLDGLWSAGIIPPRARSPQCWGLCSSNLRVNTPSSAPGAERVLSVAVAALRAPCHAGGCQTPPGLPQGCGSSERPAGCMAGQGRRESTGTQAANPALQGRTQRVSGQQEGWEDFSTWGGEASIPSAATGPEEQGRSRRAPRAAGAKAELRQGHRDQLGHRGRLDTTPGTTTGPTEHSGCRLSHGCDSVPPTPLRSLRQSIPSPRLRTALPGQPLQAERGRGFQQPVPPGNPASAGHGPRGVGPRCPWAGTEHSPSP